MRREIWDKFIQANGGLDKRVYFPLNSWMRLLANIAVEMSEQCDTARISRMGNMFKIEVGETFAENLKTPEDWVWVIGHELSHFSLGHLNKIRQSKPLSAMAWNYIFDVAIEARMFRQLPFSAPFEAEFRLKPLLNNSKDKSSAIGAFLVNPLVWKSAGVDIKKFIRSRITDKALAKRAIDFYFTLYPEGKDKPEPDFHVLVEELLFWLDGVVPLWLPIIGNGIEGKLPGWAQGPEESEVGGWESMDCNVEVQPLKIAIPKVAAEITRAVTFDRENTIERRQRVLCHTVMPVIGRKGAALLGAGIYPVFFSNKMMVNSPSNMRPQVFIDLSASMIRHWPHVYGLIGGIVGSIGEPLWGFSGKVVPLTMSQIRLGEVPISGGTAFAPIIEHAREKRFRRIIILTDGRFNESPSGIAEMVKRARIDVYVVLYNVSSRTLMRDNLIESMIRTYAKKQWTIDC
ncbi:MAG TPA: VWA domain-containing protein [candidate division Zixibacteria bacterium]|nr:VWA domain-containing protein [candidate division Zixibacteria bacterium]